MNTSEGAKWIRTDFHLHTKADEKWFKYAGKENSFVNDYVQKLKDEDIGVGIITNHNKFDKDEYKAIRKKAKKKDIYILPGIELNVKEGQNGIHTLIVFEPETWLENGIDYINRFIAETSPIDANDFNQNNGRSKHELIETINKLNDYNKNYFIVLAHVNQKNGFFEELGSRRMDFAKEPVFQKYVIGIQKFTGENQSLINDVFNKEIALVEGSDPKSIEEIGKGKKCFIKLSDYNFDAVKYALLDHKYRIASEIPVQENAFIKSAEYIGGKLDGKKLQFNPAMNNCIGIRGSGKSSILETIRYALDIEISNNAADNNYKNNLVETVLGSGGVIKLNVIDNKNESYIIKKTLNERTIILKDNDPVPNLRPEHIIKLPLYFGQKDLSSIGNSQTTKDFINRLISEKVTEQQQISEEISFNVKKTIQSIDKINTDLNKREDIQAKIAELELKIDNFKKFGIEEKLEKETIFNKDQRHINHLKSNVRQKIDAFIEFLNDNEDFSNFKTHKSNENQELFDEIKNTISNIETVFSEQFDKSLKKLEALFVTIAETEKKFQQKKENLLEEFAQIKREIKLPSDVKADDYQKYKSSLENYYLQLKELDKKSNQKNDLKQELYKLLLKLKESWQEEFKIVQSEISNVNSQQANVKIKSTFKGDKSSFASFIQDMVRGSGIRRQWIDKLVSDYNDLIDLYLDYEQKGSAFDSPEWFDDVFYDSLSDFVTYRVPDIFEIEYNGKPLAEHSLGQRASALIVFLLSLHENELIIIDQPEDDLDSQTIYNEVITTIKSIKTSTQFIFATHNPNIPVLGDCEQIHACNYDNIKQVINFISGGIDKPEIQKKIIEIMEGGKTAFEERKKKYTQWKH